MSRRATQLTLVLSFIIWPAVSFARAPQMTQASAAAAEANAQAASAQASALQAASQQATAQVTTAQTAFREAMQNYTKAPAGAVKTAAQAAVQQAQKQLVAAQTAARTSATQAMAAHSAAARAAAQAAAAQAALARQAAATPAAQPAATPTAASVSRASPATASTAGSSGGSGAKGSGAGSGGNSTLSTVLGSVFGNGSSGAAATGGKTSKNGTSSGTNAQANNGQGNAGQTGTPQGNALVGSNNGTGRGGAQPGSGATAEQQNAPSGPTRKVGAAFASGALGVGQSTDTLLTVYGCSRMGTQVMCDTDLSNQNNSVNQVSSADQWKDVYLQDDAGDNHMRSMGVFENQNGDQRASITLPYGEKSRYILVFNGVPANVKSVTLKSSKDTLDVEGIAVSSPDAAPGAQGAAPTQAAPAGIQPASAPAGRTGSRPPRS